MRTATYTISRPPITATFVAAIPRRTAEEWIRDHESWFESPREGSEGRRGAKIARVPSWERGALAKREAGTIARCIRQTLSRGARRSRKAFDLGLWLERAGVAAARPLALIEVRRAGIVRRSCVVFERIEGPTLRELLLAEPSRTEPGDAREKAKRALLQALAEEIARLHAARVRQRDLKAVNLIVADSPEGARRAWLIDLEGMEKLSRPPSRSVRVRDLARLAVSLREEAARKAGVSAEDWTRLVASYLGAAGGRQASREEVERFVADTLTWASRKEARNRKRGREIG